MKRNTSKLSCPSVLMEEIEQLLREWQDIYIGKTAPASVTDGFRLNVLREQIVRKLMELEKLSPMPGQLMLSESGNIEEVCSKNYEVPPIVSLTYSHSSYWKAEAQKIFSKK